MRNRAAGTPRDIAGELKHQEQPAKMDAMKSQPTQAHSQHQAQTDAAGEYRKLPAVSALLQLPEVAWLTAEYALIMSRYFFPLSSQTYAPSPRVKTTGSGW